MKSINNQKIETLVDKYMPAGEHRFNWNASNNSSGIYFYTLEGDDFRESRKMMFMK